MAINPFTLAVGQVSGGNWQPVTTYTDLNLRYVSAPGTRVVTMSSHLGNGVYSFANVPTGEYELYNTATKLTNFGVIKIGEDSAVLLTGNQTIGGAKTFSSQAIFSSGFKTDTIVGNTTATSGTILGVSLSGGSLDGWGVVAKTGTQTVAGDKTFTGTTTLGNATGTGTWTMDAGAKIVHPDAPTTGNHVANKTYVDAQVASVAVVPFQYGDNERFVITNGTVETNKVYTSIQTAIDSCTSPDDVNQFFIYLRRGDVFGTTNDNLFYISHAELENYVNIRGYGLDTRLIMGTTGASTTKIMSVENCSIWFGANDIATDRTYNSFTFRNCNIYAYKNLTLTGCVLHNCKIYQPSGFGITLSGATEMMNCFTTQAITNSSTGIFAGNYDALNTSYSMPTDLSLAP